MIKLFNEFAELLEKLNEAKTTKEIIDFRISLRVNNDIDITIVTDNDFIL